MQNAKRAACYFRTSKSFIAISYLRQSKLKHLPVNPFEPAAPRFCHRLKATADRSAGGTRPQ